MLLFRSGLPVKASPDLIYLRKGRAGDDLRRAQLVLGRPPVRNSFKKGISKMVDAQELHETELALNAERPTGVVSGMTLAASTVVMSNTTEHPIEVVFSGGTWTVLKKNGVTLTGMTSANQGTVPTRISLRPGSTWALTYSVAPTAVQFLYA